MIKIRRLFSLALAVALLSGLCACGRNLVVDPGPAEPTMPDSAVSGSVVPDSTASTDPNPTAVETPTPSEPTGLEDMSDPEFTPPSESTTTPIDIDIPWTDVAYSVKDNNGYTFDIVLHLSPWILLSDTDLISSAWDKVSGGNTLPQFDDWGFTRSGSEYRSSLTLYGHRTSSGTSWYITDMYYCVGTVTIKNTTSGFDVTQSDPRTVAFSWGIDEILQEPTGHIQRSIGRILYSNDAVTKLDGLDISASMSSNTWGPVPIILMTPEDISPNSPNGLAEYILRDEFVFDWQRGVAGNVGLASENTQVHLGILKSDGEYIAG